MAIPLFSFLVNAAALWLLAGACVAVAFLARWRQTFDPAAEHPSWLFFVVVFPGLALLWPVILVKALAQKRGRSPAGPVEGPVTPKGLRRNHALAVALWWAAVPLLFVLVYGMKSKLGDPVREPDASKLQAEQGPDAQARQEAIQNAAPLIGNFSQK